MSGQKNEEFRTEGGVMMSIKRTTNCYQLFRKRSHPGRGHRGSYRTAIQTDGQTDRQTDNRNPLLEGGKLKGFAMYICWGHFG